MISLKKVYREAIDDSKTLVILRGLPGSGKSTLIKNFISQVKPFSYSICSADTFFYNLGGGKYKYDPSRIADAHKQCSRKANQAMQNGVPLIFIDNTNIKKDHYQVYLDMAKRYGYKVEEKVVGGFSSKDIETSIQRNTHGVPPEVIQQMAQEFEK